MTYILHVCMLRDKKKVLLMLLKTEVDRTVWLLHFR